MLVVIISRFVDQTHAFFLLQKALKFSVEPDKSNNKSAFCFKCVLLFSKKIVISLAQFFG